MIIVIAGIKRSGSTVQYNLVRLDLEFSGYDIQINPDDYTLGGVVNLVKVHPFSKSLAVMADHIFLTHRNPREVKESLDRFSDGGEWERFLKLYKDFTPWCLHSDPDHFFLYDEWEEDRLAYTERIVDALDSGPLTMSVSPSKVLYHFDRIQLPDEGWDPVTLFHANHITSDSDE